jgi:hypothetical protein
MVFNVFGSRDQLIDSQPFGAKEKLVTATILALAFFFVVPKPP